MGNTCFNCIANKAINRIMSHVGYSDYFNFHTVCNSANVEVLCTIIFATNSYEQITQLLTLWTGDYDN